MRLECRGLKIDGAEHEGVLGLTFEPLEFPGIF